MQASNCTPIADHHGTIFMAIELSQRNWLAAVRSPDRDRIGHYKVAAGDFDGLMALIATARTSRAPRKINGNPRTLFT